MTISEDEAVVREGLNDGLSLAAGEPAHAALSRIVARAEERDELHRLVHQEERRAEEAERERDALSRFLSENGTRAEEAERLLREAIELLSWWANESELSNTDDAIATMDKAIRTFLSENRGEG